MALKIPKIGQKGYQEIAQDLIASIPRYSKNWTNYNKADPGISIIEALAYVADNLLYTMDRIPEISYLYYLRRVGGVEGLEQAKNLLGRLKLQEAALDHAQIELLEYIIKMEEKNNEGKLDYSDYPEMKGQALKFLNSRFRAVTEDDYHKLLLEVPVTNGAKIARSFLTVASDQFSRTVMTILADDIRPYSPPIFDPTPTEVSLQFPDPHPTGPSAPPNIQVFPRAFSYRITPEALATTSFPVTREQMSTFTYTPVSITDYDYAQLIYNARDHMEPRRLVGSKLEIIKPTYVQISIEIMLECASPFIGKKAVLKVIDLFQKYLDPVSGGPDKKGWPYGRSFSVHEAYHLLEAMPEVKTVNSFKINNQNLNILETGGLFDLTRIAVHTMEG